jgi:hypothetical protein
VLWFLHLSLLQIRVRVLDIGIVVGHSEFHIMQGSLLGVLVIVEQDRSRLWWVLSKCPGLRIEFTRPRSLVLIIPLPATVPR